MHATQSSKPIRPSAPARTIARSLLPWFQSHARDLPWRHTRDPYAIWVSEIMLQQTQVRTVIPYWIRWMDRLPDIPSLAAAPLDLVHKLWEGLGYYSRARNLQKAAQILVDRHEGRFPSDFTAILDLPGIGPYTAGAIASIAFNQPTPILDGNVIRVLARAFLIDQPVRSAATRDRLWQHAAEVVQAAGSLAPQPHPLFDLAGNCSSLNQALMELGATVCTPRQPDCPRCPLRRLCGANKTAATSAIPNLGPRPSSMTRQFAALIVEAGGKILVARRPDGAVNAGLWEFPNLETNASGAALAGQFSPWIGRISPPPGEFCTIRHTITRSRITLRVFRVQLSKKNRQLPPNHRWVSIAQLKNLAYPAAHRKIIDRLTLRPDKAC